MWLKIIIAGLLTLLIAFGSLATMADEKSKIIFILTEDLYELSSNNGRGGYAKLSSVAKIDKKEKKWHTFLFGSRGGWIFSISSISYG